MALHNGLAENGPPREEKNAWDRSLAHLSFERELIIVERKERPHED
jgi:hypothetical protein